MKSEHWNLLKIGSPEYESPEDGSSEERSSEERSSRERSSGFGSPEYGGTGQAPRSASQGFESKESDSAGQPAAALEINPLLNPLLEQNLGRWARVYFSNPPETRNQKVMELLRELEDQAAGAGSAGGRISAPSAITQSDGAPKVAKTVLCAACQWENQAEQKFCGACGSALRPVERRSEAYSEDPVATHSFLGLSPIAHENENDVQFLRDKAYAGAYDYEESSSGRGKYLVIAIVILLAGAAYYWNWPGRLRLLYESHAAASSPAPEQKLPPQPIAAAPTSAEPAAQPAQVSEPAAQQTVPQASPPPGAADPSPEAQSPKPAASLETLGANAGQSHKTPIPASLPASSETAILADNSPASPRTDDGSSELLLAQRYLEGQGEPRDTGLAAKWLWKAVGKQNSRADVLLADLYTRGDGVTRSCDQARLLLTAALKKGATKAASKLHNLESTPCR
jgi:TPR repeat protein